MLHRRSISILGLSLAAWLFAGASARAQEPPKVGLVTGYPASIGVLWHASDAVALRPEVSFSKASGDSTGSGSGVVTSSSGTSATFGISGLFYVGKWESLRSYVSPRFMYGRQTSDSVYGGSSPISHSVATTYVLSGSFGAEYALGRRFAVFGEAGFGYNHVRSEYTTAASTSFRSESTSKTWSSRTAVGVIVYF